jgi:hypothetical protein
VRKLNFTTVDGHRRGRQNVAQTIALAWSIHTATLIGLVLAFLGLALWIR